MNKIDLEIDVINLDIEEFRKKYIDKCLADEVASNLFLAIAIDKFQYISSEISLKLYQIIQLIKMNNNGKRMQFDINTLEDMLSECEVDNYVEHYRLHTRITKDFLKLLYYTITVWNQDKDIELVNKVSQCIKKVNEYHNKMVNPEPTGFQEFFSEIKYEFQYEKVEKKIKRINRSSK